MINVFLSRPPFLEVAKEALTKHYPTYSGAFVAGSMLRGEETSLSDIDIVVLFEDESEDVHRFSMTEQGWPIEFFVHTVSGNEHFMAEDVKQGMCATMDMMVKGIPLPEDTAFLQTRRAV